MKFGVCAGLDAAAQAAALGFDYVEPPVSGTAALSDAEFEEKLASVKAAGIETPAFNVLFPSTLQLHTASDDEIAAYLHGALARVQQLGGRVVVFGSGKSRMRPDGVGYGEAFRRLVEVTRLIGEVAAQYGITIVIEPLNRTETNMINSLAEGAALAAAVNRPNVKLLADYFHVALDGEPVNDIVRLGGVWHAHIASGHGRRYPLSEENEDYRGFFHAMKATGYQGLVSVEGRTDNMAADAPVTLALLRKLWLEA